VNSFTVFGVSGVSPAAGREAGSLIEKETLKKRISNNECRMSKECYLSGIRFNFNAILAENQIFRLS
jgi:hypothetical protein